MVTRWCSTNSATRSSRVLFELSLAGGVVRESDATAAEDEDGAGDGGGVCVRIGGFHFYSAFVASSFASSSVQFVTRNASIIGLRHASMGESPPLTARILSRTFNERSRSRSG